MRLFSLSLSAATLLSFNLAYALTPSFESSEHVNAGNNVKIHLSLSDKGQFAAKLPLPSGLNITYGDIVSLGDFYELVDQPIVQGKSPEERKLRFINAFVSFAYNTNAAYEAKQILQVIHDNQAVVDAAVERGEDPEYVFTRIANESNRQFNCITGGGCDPDSWYLTPGRYLTLAKVDFDHFGHNAWQAYMIGHEVAIDEAIAAHQNNDTGRLVIAYAMNAFANHFLSDRFATGHMRTPRVRLTTEVSPADVGSLLASYMHKEENSHGLHVKNIRGDRWIAYGDRTYYTHRNAVNRNFLLQTMQISADHIFYAFKTGKLPPCEAEAQLIPHPEEVADQAQQDVSALFYYDKDKKILMRRENVGNLYDRHWTADWWGWSTLVLLSDTFGLPVSSQAQLASSPYAERAVRDGLIKDKVILAYLQKK
jgi:hypothetical protein